jgi:hypothetical protein
VYYSMNALGSSQIAWWCWDSPGFKECHETAYASAQEKCHATSNAGYVDGATCVEKEADIAALRDCACPATPPEQPSSITISTTTAWLLALSLGAVGVALVWSRDGKRRPSYGTA